MIFYKRSQQLCAFVIIQQQQQQKLQNVFKAPSGLLLIVPTLGSMYLYMH